MLPHYINNPYEIIINEFEVEASCYAIIDGTSANLEILNRVYEDENIQYFPLYAGTDFENFTKISPLLIRLQPQMHFMNWFIRDAVTIRHDAGIVVTTKMPFNIIQYHLQECLEVILPNYNTAMFRYYDPVSFHCYAHSATEDSLKKIMTPFRNILWPYRNNSDDAIYWFMLHSESSGDDESAVNYPLRISQEEIDAMQRIKFCEFAMKLEGLFPVKQGA